ncbi:MAG: hypothetical protein ABFS45_08385 [Pseudomonadota bacterium]
MARPDVAQKQEDEDKAKAGEPGGAQPGSGAAEPGTGVKEPGGPAAGEPAGSALPTGFFSSVDLDADRLGREPGKVAEEAFRHLGTLPGAKVTVSLEIHAEVPDGVSEDLQRVVTEHCEVLKFKSHGFEKD